MLVITPSPPCINIPGAVCSTIPSVDRSTWGMGPWDNEPDQVEWESSGLTCILRRASSLGHWCGYVSVPRSHAFFGKNEYDLFDLGAHLSVHGGITYAEDTRPCGMTLTATKTTEALWWFGFDCAHGSDLCPGSRYTTEGTYRDLEFAFTGTVSLAEQIADYGKNDGKPEPKTDLQAALEKTVEDGAWDEEAPADKPKWEKVNGNLERIEVPGGWLYRDLFVDSMVFVPQPKP